VSGIIGALFEGWPTLRRFVWRLGRRLYTSTRLEQIDVNLETDGETYLQSAVLRSARSQDGPLTVLDIGANQGDWTERLLAQLPEFYKNKERLQIECFEPVPATRARLLANCRGSARSTVSSMIQIHMPERQKLS
jgi:hypothetical protein